MGSDPQILVHSVSISLVLVLPTMVLTFSWSSSRLFFVFWGCGSQLATLLQAVIWSSSLFLLIPIRLSGRIVCLLRLKKVGFFITNIVLCPSQKLNKGLGWHVSNVIDNIRTRGEYTRKLLWVSSHCYSPWQLVEARLTHFLNVLPLRCFTWMSNALFFVGNLAQTKFAKNDCLRKKQIPQEASWTSVWHYRLRLSKIPDT